MQFLKLISSLVLVTLAFISGSTATRESKCNTGTLQCCQSVQSASSHPTSDLLGVLGIVAQATTMVGSTCSPIDVIGIGRTSCNAQPVCCENNQFGGLVSLGCTPVNL